MYTRTGWSRHVQVVAFYLAYVIMVIMLLLYNVTLYSYAYKLSQTILVALCKHNIFYCKSFCKLSCFSFNSVRGTAIWSVAPCNLYFKLNFANEFQRYLRYESMMHKSQRSHMTWNQCVLLKWDVCSPTLWQPLVSINCIITLSSKAELIKLRCLL